MSSLGVDIVSVIEDSDKRMFELAMQLTLREGWKPHGTMQIALIPRWFRNPKIVYIQVMIKKGT